MNGTGAAGRATLDPVDVVVLGGGHAGVEAASAAARMGCSVALVTMDPAAIGRMSCNPAIGGTAKAHLVHEVDALGGVMGELADRTGIQFRTLNRSKGPAVWSTRCQSDRDSYARCAREHVESLEAVLIVAGTIVAAEREAAGGGVSAVLLDDGRRIACRALVIASGTFLDAVMYTGLEPAAGGRAGEAAAVGLGGWLANAGLVTHRLKTGTPPRLYRDSIDFPACDEQPGDPDPQPFSGRTDRAAFPAMPQVSCHITHTTAATHEVLRTGFDRSPIFTGAIAGRGPRYCPSIEDKLVRFADRDGHQLFIEPDGLDSDLIYLNGFSTSLPREVQAAALATIPGLERARAARPGYAVEYESVPAYQLGPTLETRLVPGLFLAGQVCGTSGYEEAAALGLMAGINAVLPGAGPASVHAGTQRGVHRRDDRRPDHPRMARALPHVHLARRAPAGAAPGQRGAAPCPPRPQARAGWRTPTYRRVKDRDGGAWNERWSRWTPVRAAPAVVEELLRAAGTAPIGAPGFAGKLGAPSGGAIPGPARAAGGAADVPDLRALLTDAPLRAQVASRKCATPATSSASSRSSRARRSTRRSGFPKRSTTRPCGRCRRRRPRRWTVSGRSASARHRASPASPRPTSTC